MVIRCRLCRQKGKHRCYCGEYFQHLDAIVVCGLVLQGGVYMWRVCGSPVKHEWYVQSELLQRKGDHPQGWRQGNVVTGYDLIENLSRKGLMLMGRCRERRNGEGEGEGMGWSEKSLSWENLKDSLTGKPLLIRLSVLQSNDIQKENMRELYYTPDLRRNSSMKDNNPPLIVKGNSFLQTKRKKRQVPKIIKMPLVTPKKNKEQDESGNKT